MRHAVVTSFDVSLWSAYAHRTYPTVLRGWDATDEFVVLTERPKAIRKQVLAVHCRAAPRVVPLSDDCLAFVAANESNRAEKFERSCVRFAPKAFALLEAALSLRSEGVPWMVWLDADVECHRAVSVDVVASWLRGSVCHLPRPTKGYSETGFLALRVEDDDVLRLLRALVDLYPSGGYRQFRQWHDAYLFSRLLESGIVSQRNVFSLATRDVSHVFDTSALSPYLRHYKGKRKARLV